MPALQITGGRSYRLTALDAALVTAIHRGPVCPLYADILTRVRAALGCELARPTVMYEGGAAGADTDARAVARRGGLEVLTFPADWDQHGKAAGPIRNADMLAGRHPSGDVEPPSLVLAFPGGTGTADMVARARAAGIPVLDLGGDHRDLLATCQRWTKDDAWLVLHGGPQRVAAARADRPGVGLPVFSGHWLKVHGRTVIPAWAEYIGRDAHGLAGHPLFFNPFPIRPVGQHRPGIVVVKVDGQWAEMSLEKALEPFERHLRELARQPHVRSSLLQLYTDGKVLVCWCDSRKPCHACIVARAALLLAADAANRQVWATVAPSPA